jgi:hypothetical protein
MPTTKRMIWQQYMETIGKYKMEIVRHRQEIELHRKSITDLQAQITAEHEKYMRDLSLSEDYGDDENYAERKEP